VTHARAASGLMLFAVVGAGCAVRNATSHQTYAPPLQPTARVVCTRYASPSVAHAARGTSSEPYASVQRLVDSLRPGQTGCLKPGRYQENVTFRRGGTRMKEITLTSAPGGRRAILLGTLWVARGADYVTISDLYLDGRSADGKRGQPSPQVNGNHVTLRNDDITNDHTGICLMIGGAAETYGTPSYTSIERSRIHDCGSLPATHYGQAVYLGHSRYASIEDNYIYDDADWGIHLYPNAVKSVIAYNVIDGNGSGLIIGGTDHLASSDNYIAHNIFSNSTDGYHVTSFWGPAVGDDNVVTHNCFWNATSGNINTVNGGFSATANLVVEPRYVSRSKKDFRLRPGSPCADNGPRMR
jgi:hypothetical protein